MKIFIQYREIVRMFSVRENVSNFHSISFDKERILHLKKERKSNDELRRV